MLKEQQILSQVAGNMLGAVSVYAEQKAKEAEKEVKQAEAALQAAEKAGNTAKIQEKQTAYAEAKARKESWEDGGANKRRMDAAVMAITTVLSGGNAGQTAVAALSPELNAQIHELTKDSKTANLLAHAALSALEAKASGTSAAAGAIAGVAGEATAMLLAETVFNKQPTELTTEERNLLKVAGQLAGAVSGNLASNTTADTVMGAETAKRAVENNLLSRDEDEYVLDRTTEFNEEGKINEKHKAKTKELLFKNSYINYLIKLNQEEPNKLNNSQKEYLHKELVKISNSYNISIDDLYSWDFAAPAVKRDDTKLSRYLAMDEYFWNQSYEGKQAKSTAIGITMLPIVYGGDKIVRFYSELTKGIASNPVLSETAVVVGYKSGELVGEGKVFVNGKFNQSGFEDITKDGLKTLALGKLPLWQQALYGTAIDYGYEVNKYNATSESVKTEMISSAAGVTVSGISELGSQIEPRLNGINKVILSIIGGDKISDYIKEERKDNK